MSLVCWHVEMFPSRWHRWCTSWCSLQMEGQRLILCSLNALGAKLTFIANKVTCFTNIYGTLIVIELSLFTNIYIQGVQFSANSKINKPGSMFHGLSAPSSLLVACCVSLPCSNNCKLSGRKVEGECNSVWVISEPWRDDCARPCWVSSL